MFKKFKEYNEKIGRDKAFLKILIEFISNIANDIDKCKCKCKIIKSPKILHILISYDKKWKFICKQIIKYNFDIDKKQIENESEGKKSINFNEYNNFWFPRLTRSFKVLMYEKFDGLKQYWK